MQTMSSSFCIKDHWNCNPSTIIYLEVDQALHFPSAPYSKIFTGGINALCRALLSFFISSSWKNAFGQNCEAQCSRRQPLDTLVSGNANNAGSNYPKIWISPEVFVIWEQNFVTYFIIHFSAHWTLKTKPSQSKKNSSWEHLKNKASKLQVKWEEVVFFLQIQK